MDDVMYDDGLCRFKNVNVWSQYNKTKETKKPIYLKAKIIRNQYSKKPK